jgi:hypothetical protein
MTASIVLPVHPSQLADAETDYTRAKQRYQSAKRACTEMHGSLSILVVPQSDYKVLADASYQARAALLRLGDLQARKRAEISLACHS